MRRRKHAGYTARYAAAIATACAAAGIGLYQPTEVASTAMVENYPAAAGLKSYAPLLESGDIIFRREDSIWGDISSSMARRDGRYSHVGIIQREGDDIWVIHSYANPDDEVSHVSRHTLEQFAGRAQELGYYRLSLPPSEREKVASTALGFANAKTPFDPEFSLLSENRLYCTELIWKSVRIVTGLDIAPDKGHAFGQEFIGNDDLFLGGYMKEINLKQ